MIIGFFVFAIFRTRIAGFSSERRVVIMEKINAVLESIDGFVWGVPLIVLIFGTGLYLTCRLRVLQFRKLGKALK